MTIDFTQETISRFNAPWSLRFERDGTEDVAVLCDADDDELVRSRHFWLPNADDPEPPTLAAMRLMQTAPAMLDALRLAQQALNATPRFAVGDTDSYRIAAVVHATLAGVPAGGGDPHVQGEPDFRALLAKYRQVGVLWCCEDVKHVRPDLTDDQAWDVLQECIDKHDCEWGFTWTFIKDIADILFHPAPATDETEEE